jgi:SAM-dependent methyltransferase
MGNLSPTPESIAQYSTTDRLNARIALHREFSTAGQSWHRWLFEQLEFSTGAAVLEVGCGTGELWHANLDRLGSWNLTLSDQSEAMAQAAAKAVTGHITAQAMNCDVQALPFPEACFDGALACHMLYHVPDIARGIAELRRVLRPGGNLYAATNSAENMQALLSLILELDPGVDTTHSGYRFTLENGEAMLRQSFARCELRTFDDSLHVTRAQPLLDYILSMALHFRYLATGEGQAAALSEIQRRIDCDGAIDISKRAGVFVCR